MAFLAGVHRDRARIARERRTFASSNQQIGDDRRDQENAADAGHSWLPLVLSFKWPSVAYALDIVGWDVFFPLSMWFAAPVLGGDRLTTSIRWLMFASGGLALAGLSGLVTGDMRLRNIGVVGYVGVFLIVATLLAVLFYRAKPVAPTTEP